jgi:hypothetical protein
MRSQKITLAQALEQIQKAGFNPCGEYGSIDWRMICASGEEVGFTAWPTRYPTEQRHLFEFSMGREGMVDREELRRAVATGIEMATLLQRELERKE